MASLVPIPSVPLAVLPEYPSVGESLLFQFNGLVVVTLALCAIWGVLELTGLYFKRAARSAPKVAAPVPAAEALESRPAVVPAELVAIIAGAVHATINGPHRILAVRPADAPVDWAREGRRQIFASHQVR